MIGSASSLFHDNWYQVSELCFRLNPWVRVHRQTWRGELWFLLSDPYTGKSYRIRPEAWNFLLLLDGRLSLEQAWKRSLGICPADTPGQVELIHLMAQLNREHLLGGDRPRNLDALFGSQELSRSAELRSRIMNFLFIPIPLWNPDSFLRSILPLGKLIFSVFGLMLWVLVFGAALLALAGNSEGIMAPAQGLLALENLSWLYLSWALVKLCHELGHALCCRSFGGQVTLMGIMLLVFAPIPYVDTSSAWLIRERWKRVLINASGMLSELFLASVAALIWCFTGQGAIHSLAWNLMMIASISTVVFNINPLLRLDGYYILSDLADIPNLHHRALKSLSELFDRLFLGVPLADKSPRFFLSIYALASGLYRIAVSFLIIALVAGKFFELGLILGALCLVFWVLTPLVNFFRYILGDRGKGVGRTRRTMTATAFAAVMTYVGLILPIPVLFSAPGVLCGLNDADIIAKSAGEVARVFFKSGDRVQRGDLIVQLEDGRHELEMKRLEARKDEIMAALSALMALEPGRADFFRLQLQALERELEQVQGFIQGLSIRAQSDGIIWLPENSLLLGQWMQRGQVVARILDSSFLRFHVVFPQEQGARLYDMGKSRTPSLEILVRLRGMGFSNLKASLDSISPSELNVLPSASLGMAAGGAVAVDFQDPSGLKTQEPCFEALLALDWQQIPAPGYGRTGTAFFRIGQSPLGYQLLRWFRQLLQKRYRL